MTGGKIEANKAEFKAFFLEEFWFLIPEYQSYVWQVDNISELVEDLIFAFENKPENDYFLGSLVLKKIEEALILSIKC